MVDMTRRIVWQCAPFVWIFSWNATPGILEWNLINISETNKILSFLTRFFGTVHFWVLLMKCLLVFRKCFLLGFSVLTNHNLLLHCLKFHSYSAFCIQVINSWISPLTTNHHHLVRQTVLQWLVSCPWCFWPQDTVHFLFLVSEKVN